MPMKDLCLSPQDAATLLLLIDNTSMFRHSSDAKNLLARIEAHAALVPVPLGKDKVYCGLTPRLVEFGATQNQARTVVRAPSRAAAVRMLRDLGCYYINDSHMKQYWSETRNTEELAIVKERGVYVKGTDGQWKKVKG